ncbi:MAG TPA: glycosyltransferase family 1 protein [Anaerolineae bacterium]|nr:glycosyltransferase family 1 protein [Anaerolineae bacterium]
MRILIDATPLQTGHRARGVGTYTRELLRALLALDRENDYRLLVHPHTAQPAGTLPDLGLLPPNASLVTLPRPELGRLSGFASHQAALPVLLARQQADLFHSPGFVAAFSVPGVPWRCPLPLVVTLHDFIPLHVPALFNGKAVNRWWYSQQMRLARRARRLICVSQATRDDALRFMGAERERCTVIYEGVDQTVFHPQTPPLPAPDPPYILFVGGDYVNKNRPAALAAFALLTQATTLPHHLLLVGRDATSDDELVRRTPGIDLGRLRRIEQVDQVELASLYRQADLFLFPSTCEGFGLPVLEAMASGAPVVTSTASSLPEVAGQAALLVDPHDTAGLAAAMIQILADRALHSRLRAAGLARAAEFTWQAAAEQTLAVYRQMV